MSKVPKQHQPSRKMLIASPIAREIKTPNNNRYEQIHSSSKQILLMRADLDILFWSGNALLSIFNFK